jgi:hypothetical protein
MGCTAPSVYSQVGLPTSETQKGCRDGRKRTAYVIETKTIVSIYFENDDVCVMDGFRIMTLEASDSIKGVGGSFGMAM